MTDEEEIELMCQFSNMFNGGIWYDCGRGGKLTYSPKLKEGEREKTFDASFLEEDEVTDLMQKSIKDGINYLFEKVKDFEYIITYDDGYRPVVVFLKQCKKR